MESFRGIRVIFLPNKQYLIRFHPAREIRELVVFSTDAETDAFIQYIIALTESFNNNFNSTV